MYLSLLKHTWNSSVVSYMSCHGPPHIKKEIHSVVNEGRVGDTSGSCVPPEWTCCRVCLPCAQPLDFSAHYSPRGGSTERHRSEAHTATHAFPCQQSQLTRDPDSRMFLFHNFIRQLLLLHRQSPHLFSNVWTSCIMTENGRTRMHSRGLFTA